MTAVLTAAGIVLLLIFCLRPGRRISPEDLGGSLFAHRGLWDAANEENTLRAFDLAAQHGYGIEMDVRVTKDGVPVILHDPAMGRMYGVPLTVETSMCAELRAHPAPSGQLIPTLEEALETVSGRCPLILEIKQCRRRRQVLPHIQRLLDAYEGQYCVESFDPLILLWYRHHRPGILRGQLAFRMNRRYPYRPGYFLQGTLLQLCLSRPNFIAFDIHSLPSLPLRLVRLFRPLLVAWTVQSPEELSALRGTFPAVIFEAFRP